MSDTTTLLVTELSPDDARATSGGVTEGGCIDPTLQKIIDALTGQTPAGA